MNIFRSLAFQLWYFKSNLSLVFMHNLMQVLTLVFKKMRK